MQEDKVEQRERLIEMLRRRLGPRYTASLDDPDVTDLLFNEDGTVLEDRARVGKQIIGTMDADILDSVIRTTAAIAGVVINADQPVLECEFYNGSRFTGLMWPATKSPAIAIRRPAPQIYPLEQYVADGIMTEAQMEAIKDAVRRKLNIVVSGGTGSGKTTLLNAVAQEIGIAWPDDRMVMIEKVAELQFPNKDKVCLRVTNITPAHLLVQTALRLRPDRIIIGEIRGAEAIDFIEALNTGHEGGLTTVHANTVASTLTRIEDCARGAQVFMPRRIAEAVNLIVSIAREETGRRVREVARVTGYDDDSRQYKLEYVGEPFNA